MMKAVIYARVSSLSERQTTDRQVCDLQKYAHANNMEVVNTFQEHISGAKRNEERAVLTACLDYCINNDVNILLISELSRLGRNVLEVQETVKYCSDNHVNVFFQKENMTLLNADGQISPITSVLIACLGMVAQLERENIKFRLNSGRALAISKGVKMGRKVGSCKSREQKANEYKDVIKCLRKGLSISETFAICNQKGTKCSISTIKRVKKEFVG